MGSLAGGACVCRSKESASLLREARKERSRLLAEMQCDFKSRYISEKEQLWLEYYGGVEAINGWLTKEELGQIMDIFKDMDDIFRKRESRCRVLQEESLINIYGDRLPVAVPLKYSKELEDALLQNDFELRETYMDELNKNIEAILEKHEIFFRLDDIGSGNGIDRWKCLEEKITFLPVQYQLESIRYQARYFGDVYHKYVDLPLIIKSGARDIGLWPICLMEKDGVWQVGSLGGEIKQPLFLENELSRPNTQRKYLGAV